MEKQQISVAVLRSLAVALCVCACTDATAQGKEFQFQGNPIVRDNFTADPAPMVWGDRLYLYVGHDEWYDGQDKAGGGKEFNITEWLCYSTADMQTWTDHGSVLRPGHFAWGDTVTAGVGTAWASQVVPRHGKFYYYTTLQGRGENAGYAVGVAVSDSPTGPFRDAIGKPLVTDKMTPNGARGWWNDIDPTVLIDDDGQAYLCWGNGTCFMAKLKENMTELDGDIWTVPVPRYTEGPWLHKRNGIYYLTYASQGFDRKEAIDYCTATDIRGPWTHHGQVTNGAENSFTIHPGIVEFKGQWYLFYHNATLTLDGHKGAIGRRSVCVDKLFYNEDGTMQFVRQTQNTPDLTVGGNVIMRHGDFGLTTNLRSWGADARTVSVSAPQTVTDDYDMLTGKRRHCHNEGMERTCTVVNPQGDTLLIVMREYKDGFAFRYVLPRAKAGETVTADNTAYRIPVTAKRWMQIYDGPGYEHFFPLCEGGVSPEGEKHTNWGYPALIEVMPPALPRGMKTETTEAKPTYMLITEADVLRGQCGSMLANSADERNVYKVQLFDNMPLAEDAKWQSPWRVVITGSLADIVASTLVTDVATPCKSEDTAWIKPGVSSWIYWAHNHGSQEYSILKEYVDLAKAMKWPYTLVDAEWDVMRGGNIEQLCSYSVSQGVKPMMWYNSTTNWTGKWAPTPQGLLNAPTDREKEFAKIASWGVKGVKIDFFRDDKVETIDYYIDLLEAAGRNNLLVNFHGGTIPRGWQRTYPNFISAESVRGAEWYNNTGELTNKAARHNATLPFTRNVIGSMDYTPGTFTDSQHPHITTHAHELALTMLFESGIQHMPDRPEAYLTLPKQVKGLLSALPTVWDDTQLLAGYPGESIVMARRSGKNWYIAGINGLDTPQTLSFALPETVQGKKAVVIADGSKQKEFVIKKDKLGRDILIDCLPRGGFVITVSE